MVSQELKVARSRADTFEALTKTVQHLGWNLLASDPVHFQLRAKTRASLRSWGEILTAQVADDGPASRVTVVCEPSAQLFDWGKSTENLETFTQAFRETVSGGHL
jgi:hypothetical protein